MVRKIGMVRASWLGRLRMGGWEVVSEGEKLSAHLWRGVMRHGNISDKKGGGSTNTKKGNESGSLRNRFPWGSWATEYRPFSYYYPGFAREGADFGGEGVEVVETAVVAVGGDSGNGTHGVEIPRGQYQQASADTGLEPLTLGFPIGTDGLFLQMYQRIALL